MLRITRSESGDGVVLFLEGKLLEPWVGELCAAIGSAGSTTPLVLDLAALRFADSVGALLLATLQRRGVVLREPSAFIAALVAAAIE
jgi:anti-anti-sigma regulatory factor